MSWDVPLWLRIQKLFGAKIVALKDHDGTITYRKAVNTPFGLSCERWAWKSVRPLILNPDGTISPECYVEEWREV